nr:hybrid signal transduction histidine kinase M [Tanacetum cinerariifolium]
MTLSKTLQARLVVEDPQTTKKVWDLLAEICNDNKRSRSIALKAKLRSMKLGYLSIDAYFRKIYESPVVEVLSKNMEHAFHRGDILFLRMDEDPILASIITHREPFLDLKTAYSMLTTEEMRFKSRAQATSIDSTSSSPRVLLANSGSSTRCSIVATDKPCPIPQAQTVSYGQPAQPTTNGQPLHMGQPGLLGSAQPSSISHQGFLDPSGSAPM